MRLWSWAIVFWIGRAASQAVGPNAHEVGQEGPYCSVEPYVNDWAAAQITHRLDRALKAVDAQRARLTEDYGDYAKLLFDTTLRRWGGDERPEVLAWLTGTSAERLKRRFLRAMAKNQPFVLAAGGHSAAVAHGNYWEESYSHRVGEFLCPVFAEMATPVVVRDHGMGAQGGCPSCLAMANQYGPDADLIFWDFGMTDHSEETRDYYVRQALLLPKQPTVLMFYNVRNERKGFLEHAKSLHEAGFGIGGCGGQRYYDYTDEGRFPPADADPESVPYWLRGLQAYPKKQDAGPGSERYNSSVVKDCGGGGKFSGQAKWHPGFKEHRLVGYIVGSLLLDVLEDALDEYNNWVIQNGDEELDEDELVYLPPEITVEPDAPLAQRTRLPLPPGGCVDLPWCNHPMSARNCQSPHAAAAQHWGISDIVIAEAALPPSLTKYAGNMVAPDEEDAQCGVDVREGGVITGRAVGYPPTPSCTHHLDAFGFVPLTDRWLVMRLPFYTRNTKEAFVEEFRLDDSEPMVQAWLDEPVHRFGKPVVVLCKTKDFFKTVELEINGVATPIRGILNGVCQEADISDELHAQLSQDEEIVIALRRKEGSKSVPRLTTVAWLY